MEKNIKSKFYMYSYGILVASSGFIIGFGVGIFNSFFNQFIEYVYGVTDENKKIEIQGNLNFFFLIGGALASFTIGFLYEKIGRWKTTIFLLIIEIILFAVTLVQSLIILYFARFGLGFIAASWNCVAYLKIKENFPISYRPTLSSLYYIISTIGILISYSFSSSESAKHWRLILTYPVFLEIPKLFLFLFVFKMESPLWMFSNLKSNAEIERNFSYLYNESALQEVNDEFIHEMKLLNNNENSSITFKDLVSKDYRLQFILGFILNALNQLTGINVLVFYSNKIFSSLNLDNPSVLTFFMGVTNFLGSVFLSMTMNKFGKKSFLVFGLGFQSLSYFSILSGIIFDKGFLVIAGAYLYIFSFAVSIGGMLYIYLADILPPLAISITSIIQWTLACIIAKVSIVLVDKFGTFSTFFTFMIISAIGCFITAGYAIETIGKSDLQIKREFMSRKFMS